MNGIQRTVVGLPSARKLVERADRKRPEQNLSRQGCVTCPLCENVWMSPDKCNVKFCKRCRGKVPHIEAKSVLDGELVYFEGF